MLKQDAKNPTFVPQEQGMFTESATGLIVCVFRACGGNGEEGVERKKKKKVPLCRLKGGRSRRCGLHLMIDNDLMGAASEEPTFTEVQSHRK